jgi:hypothetical protein
MLYLAADTAAVTGIFTLDEGRSIYASPFTYYLLTLESEDNGHSSVDSSQVMTDIQENNRYTRATFATTGLKAGRYAYTIYGQTSSTNTDVNDSSVVGIIERGILQLTATNNIFEHGEHTINRDIEAV